MPNILVDHKAITNLNNALSRYHDGAQSIHYIQLCREFEFRGVGHLMNLHDKFIALDEQDSLRIELNEETLGDVHEALAMLKEIFDHPKFKERFTQSETSEAYGEAMGVITKAQPLKTQLQLFIQKLPNQEAALAQ